MLARVSTSDFGTSKDRASTSPPTLDDGEDGWTSGDADDLQVYRPQPSADVPGSLIGGFSDAAGLTKVQV